MSDLVINVQHREHTGKNESRRLRKEGLVPAVIYGDAKPPVSVSVGSRELKLILHSATGMNTIFDVALVGTDQKRPVRIIDFQVHPLTEALTHVDFVRVVANVEIHVNVHVELVGTAFGVKTEGGILEFTHREIAVACLPKDIPASIRLDISDMKLGHVHRVADLQLPPGVRTLTSPDQVICAVHAPQAEEAPSTTAAADATAAVPAAGATDDKAKESAAKGSDKDKK